MEAFPSGSPPWAGLPKLTPARARAMLADLLLGFSSKSFQRKLDVLVSAQISIGLQDLFHVPGRKELALTVQREVLPRYGFDGSESGVAQMVKVMQPLLAVDSRLADQSEAIKQKLKLSSKAGSESDSSEDEMPNGHKRLKREKAVALQNTLLAEYSGPEFQMKLRTLIRKGPENRDELKRLVRDIQMAVLPRYGFPASDTGINAMKEAFEEWHWDNEVRNLSRAIEEQLTVCMNDAIAERTGISSSTANCKELQTPPTSAAHSSASSASAQHQERERSDSWKPEVAVAGEDQSRIISKAETVQLLRELLVGFSSTTFQWKMSLLKKGIPGEGFCLDGSEELALSVQREVLPRYGFKGTRRGVVAMICECSRYARDQEVIDLHNAINEQLGMDLAARQRFWKRLGNATSRA